MDASLPSTMPSWDHAMYLVIDTVTTGLQQAGRLPLRLVEIGWMLCRSGTEIEEERTFLITPDRFSIPMDAIDIFGIDTETALTEGIPCRDALLAFWSAYERCDVLVGHNLDFDEMVIHAETVRQGIALPALNPGRVRGRVCTMRASIDFCNLPAGPGGEKRWPSLAELYHAVYQVDSPSPHRAGPDVKACASCFFALKERGLIVPGIETPPFWGL